MAFAQAAWQKRAVLELPPRPAMMASPCHSPRYVLVPKFTLVRMLMSCPSTVEIENVSLNTDSCGEQPHHMGRTPWQAASWWVAALRSDLPGCERARRHSKTVGGHGEANGEEYGPE